MINSVSANNKQCWWHRIRKSGKQLISVYMGNCNLIVINISDIVNHFHYRKWQKHCIFEILEILHCHHAFLIIYMKKYDSVFVQIHVFINCMHSKPNRLSSQMWQLNSRKWNFKAADFGICFLAHNSRILHLVIILMLLPS